MDAGSATVSDVVDSLPKNPPLAYSTVLTTMRILETKGYLRHNKNGRASVYYPAVGREQARQRAVMQLVDRLFEKSPELLILNRREAKKIDSRELKRLRKRIEDGQDAAFGWRLPPCVISVLDRQTAWKR